MAIVMDESASSIIEHLNPWWIDPGSQRPRTMNRRELFETLWSHVNEHDGTRAAVLIGARQVGKTTLLLQIVDRALAEGWPSGNITFFDFSDDRLVESISPRAIVENRPPGFREDRPRLFLFDEIQEAMQWQRWLKGAVDEARRSQPETRPIFIVTVHPP